MIDFFQKVEKFIIQSSHVIDFFMGKDKIYIIELNPFHSGAGSGLFSWSEDRNLLFNGPIEFRFNKKKKSGDFSTIQMEKFLIKKYGFFDQIEGHEKFKKSLQDKKIQEKTGIQFYSIISLFVVFFSLGFYFYKRFKN